MQKGYEIGLPGMDKAKVVNIIKPEAVSVELVTNFKNKLKSMFPNENISDDLARELLILGRKGIEEQQVQDQAKILDTAKGITEEE